ncbi:hypothetical protein PT974_08539 [Cladobotryum mycophilum]|uniref:HNH nuclease domain-containing protein n=1 Tax=Cladobotryum mycophilum TaxID=491253 RepID=A0ABR0SEK9_9HYPO
MARDKEWYHNAMARCIDKFTEDQQQEMLQFLTFSPKLAKPSAILSMDHVERKLELIQSILQKFKNSTLNRDKNAFGLNNVQLSTFLHMTIPCLEEYNDPVHIRSYLCMHELLAFFMNGRMIVSDLFPSFDISANAFKQMVANEVPPNMAEREKCIARDKSTCHLTGATSTEVCHIVPIGINSSEKSILYYGNQFHFITRLLGDASNEIHNLLLSNPGSLDQDWNMLCLCPHIRSWWKAGYFTLKWHGVTPQEDMALVALQFHWMPRNGLNPYAKAQISTSHVNKMLEPISDAPDRPDATIILRRTPQTGQFFTILMEDSKVDKMKAMVDLQWMMLRVAGMAGVAGAPGRLDRFDETSQLDEVEETDGADEVGGTVEFSDFVCVSTP